MNDFTVSASCCSVGAGLSARVVRGGSFNNNERAARCAYRNNNTSDNRNNNIGFRVAVAHTSQINCRKCWAEQNFSAEDPIREIESQAPGCATGNGTGE